MDKTTDFRRSRHVVSALHVHLVFVTKYPRGRLTTRVRALLAQSFGSVCLDFGAFLEACDGEEDHVHLLVAYPPGVAVATLVNSLKGVSSRYVRASRFAEVRSRSADAFWSPSYFAASCGGAALDTVRRYVENKRRPKALAGRAGTPA